MTRPGRSSRGVAALFARDPDAAVRRVVRDAGTAIGAAAIKRVLGAAGVPGLDRGGWDRLQRRLRSDEHIVVEPGYRYRWVDQPRPPTPAEAFERIVRAAGAGVNRAAVEAVRAALVDAPSPLETQAQHRQAVLDGLRALAELASEVEELAVNQASTRAMIHRVRSRVRLAGLEPIERAGETVPFDRRQHEPIGPSIRDGAPVIVVRPGYRWTSSQEVVLLAPAAVQE